MKIILIRHADPDYSIDSLTPTGHREAKLLSEYLKDRELGHIFVSPMGRAQRTMQYVLDAKGINDYEVLDWVHEFEPEVNINNDELNTSYAHKNVDENGQEFPRIAWDMYPRAFEKEPRYFDLQDWPDSPVGRHSVINEQYEYVTGEFDKLLARFGYERKGMLYHTEQGNHETLTIFCHFGVSMVILSHLLHVTPFVLWQGICAAPSSITELVSEEREKGVVSFRALKIGATPHLDVVNQQPSFAARFCETYEDPDRH